MPRTSDFVIDFRQAQSLDALAVHIGAPLHVLEEVVNASDQAVYYRKHEIPKRRPKGATRRAWEALSDDLGDAHRSLARRFDAFARDIGIGYPQPQATGYVRGASIFKNAQVHAGARLILRTDIRDFFESISTPMLERLLLHCGVAPSVGAALARFITINGTLPLGLHTSPLFANLICIELDGRLEALAQKQHCVVTRYADDITFSGERLLPSRLAVESAVRAHGFSLSPRKFRATVRGQAHYVTGLSVSESVPRAPRKLKRRLRQELYYSNKFGIESHLETVGAPSLQAGVNRIDGTIRFLNSIEPALAGVLRASWHQLLRREDLRPAYVPRGERETRRVTILLDESELKTDNGTVLVVGCVTTIEVNLLASAASDLLDKYVQDPFAAGRKAVLQKRGLHFSGSSGESVGV